MPKPPGKIGKSKAGMNVASQRSSGKHQHVDLENSRLLGMPSFSATTLREGATVTFRQTEDEEAILGWIPNPEAFGTIGR